jgi:hypothetical protein
VKYECKIATSRSAINRFGDKFEMTGNVIGNGTVNVAESLQRSFQASVKATSLNTELAEIDIWIWITGSKHYAKLYLKLIGIKNYILGRLNCVINIPTPLSLC